MPNRARPKLTYANVCATLALFLAIGGGAYAATRLPANSVGTPQLKKGAVATAKLKANAVTGAKVADGSLTGADINASTLGTVPSAASATHAGSADSAMQAASAETATHADSATSASEAADAGALQGHPASDFVPASRLPGVNRSAVGENELAELISNGTLNLAAYCPAGVGFDQATLLLKVEGSSAFWDSVSSIGANGGELADEEFAEIGRTPVALNQTTHAGGTINAVAEDGKALHISFEQRGANSQGGGCIFSVSAISG
jgi:hypothetical protein